MANIKGQIKRNRQTERRRARNKTVRSELKSRVKVARDAVDARAADAPDKVRTAQKRLNKAAAGGRIHKNAAARRTSRLMKRASQQPAPAKKQTAKKTAKKAVKKTAKKA